MHGLSHPRMGAVRIPALLLGVTTFCVQYVVVVSPSVRTLLSLSAGRFGWLLSSWLVSGIFGSLIAGWLADRGRMRHAAFGALALVVWGYALCALPPSYLRYVVGMMAVGMGNYAIGTLANVAVVRSTPAGARRALTWLQLTAAGAGMVGPIVWAAGLRYLAHGTWGLRGAVQSMFLLAACLCTSMVPVVARWRVPEGRGASPHDGLRPPVGGAALLVVCLYVALHTAADNGMYVWLPDFATRRFSPSPFPVAWIISAYSGAYLVGRLALTGLPDRVGDLTVLGFAAGAGAVLSALAFQSGSQYALAVLYTAAGLALSMDYPAILSHIGRAFPHATGRVMALAGAVSGGASFLVPPLIGYIGAAAGSMVAGMMLPPAMLAALSVAAFLHHARRGGGASA